MSDVLLLLFMIVLFAYTAYALWTAPRQRTLTERARQRRTNPVWKDRGTL